MQCLSAMNHQQKQVMNPILKSIRNCSSLSLLMHIAYREWEMFYRGKVSHFSCIVWQLWNFDGISTVNSIVLVWVYYCKTFLQWQVSILQRPNILQRLEKLILQKSTKSTNKCMPTFLLCIQTCLYTYTNRQGGDNNWAESEAAMFNT